MIDRTSATNGVVRYNCSCQGVSEMLYAVKGEAELKSGRRGRSDVLILPPVTIPARDVFHGGTFVENRCL